MEDFLIEMIFPFAGIDIAHSFQQQPGGTTPIGINVRAYEPSANRMRGGARPGLVPYLPLPVSAALPMAQQGFYIVTGYAATLTVSVGGGGT